VRETGYQLFGDHKFIKYNNDMIFGSTAATASGDETQEVTEPEAGQLLALVNSLGDARQTL
jgi:hypothetical protein